MKENIKDIVPTEKIYRDSLSPAVKQIGKALESIAKTSRFLLAPIDYLAAQHDRWERYLQKVADRVKEENLVEGAPQIVIPTLEALSLQTENTLLSELFINLLSNSIDSTKQKYAHPAFPKIISQLSHDEAIVIFYLKAHSYHFSEYDKFLGNDTYMFEKKVNETFPVNKLLFPELLKVYDDHLESLNIIQISLEGEEDSTDKNGSLIGKTSKYERLLSDFGQLFVQSCVPDKFIGL